MKYYKIIFVNNDFDVSSLNFMIKTFINEILNTDEHDIYTFDYSMSGLETSWNIGDPDNQLNIDELIKLLKADRWINDVYFNVYTEEERVQAFRYDCMSEQLAAA